MGTTVTALDTLRGFIRAKDCPAEQAEIREYCRAHAGELAAAFGRTETEFREAVEAVGDDAVLGKRLLLTIQERRRFLREARCDRRIEAAVAAASRLETEIRWKDGCAMLPELSAVLHPNLDAFLCFASPFATIAVPVRKIRKVLALKRRDLAWSVGPECLQARWKDGRGGLNLATFTTEREREAAGFVEITLPPNDPAHAWQALTENKVTAPKDVPTMPKPERRMKKAQTVEEIVSAFQRDCLATLDKARADAMALITTEATAHEATREELAEVRGELARAHEEIARMREGAERLVVWQDAANDAPTLTEDAPKLARMRVLEQALKDERAALKAAEVQISELKSDLVELGEHLSEVKEELAEKDDTANDESAAALDKLLAELPEPMAFAAELHDYLRSEGLLPVALDAPFALAPHAYRVGLTEIAENAIPDVPQ
jgi:hypothetical protein